MSSKRSVYGIFNLLKGCRPSTSTHCGIAVRVKGGKSLQNGMWHGVQNGIIMRNTIYAGNKLTDERILFSRQFYKSSSFSMLRTILKTIKQQIEDKKIYAWDRTCLIAG